MIYELSGISMYVCDKMHPLRGVCLLTGFLQASIQCWQDIWISTRIQRVGTCGCPVFSSVFILAGSEQDKSWLLQSWCRGQWTWCFEDYTVWEARYPGKCFFLFSLYFPLDPQNVCNGLPGDPASYPRRADSSTTMLRKSQNSHDRICY